MEAYRNVTEDGQQDVDEEVGIATALKEHTQRWEDDGKDDFADITVMRSCQRNPAQRAARKPTEVVGDNLRCGERHVDVIDVSRSLGLRSLR